MKKTTVYFGLGSNIDNELGTSIWHMKQAIHQISMMHQHGLIAEKPCDVSVSSLYKSLPMGPSDQPDFYNAVVGIHLTESQVINLSAHELLTYTQNIEKSAQRDKQRHWGERCIDIDILFYDSMVLTTAELTIPHIGIFERNFVAVPLYEIAPNLCILDKKLCEQKIAHDMTGLSLYQKDWY